MVCILRDIISQGKIKLCFFFHVFREELQIHQEGQSIANGMLIIHSIWWRRKRLHSATMVGHWWMLIIKGLQLVALDLLRPLISFHSQLPPLAKKTAPPNDLIVVAVCFHVYQLKPKTLCDISC